MRPSRRVWCANSSVPIPAVWGDRQTTVRPDIRRAIGENGRVANRRVLFTCRPLAGHYEPLVPLAAATRAAGYVVAFATGEPYDQRARRDGFEAFRVGPPEGFRDEWAPRFPGFERLVGDEQRRFFFTEIFANLELEPRAEELEVIVDVWAPQLVVHEVAELAAPLISAARGIPYVDVSYGRLIPGYVLRATGEAAAPHWRARGLDPHPVAGLFEHLYVDTCPPSLQNPEIASLPAVQALRPAAAELVTTTRPGWLDRFGDRPIVYVTMGTVWNRDLDLFRRVIDALRDEPVGLVVTVGQQNDPDALGPQPDDVVVRRYLPQAELLPYCHAVVTHGGAGTTLGALGHGLPLLVLPQGADQYANADAIVEAGAGLCHGRDETTIPAIRDSVRSLLDNPDYRRAAKRVQAEIRAMPTEQHAIRRIEMILTPAYDP
jgi:UDP:flavonoid glycosyltransferase YjiC (YdhE family)